MKAAAKTSAKSPKASTPKSTPKKAMNFSGSVKTRQSIASATKPKQATSPIKTSEKDNTTLSTETDSKAEEKKSSVNLGAWDLDPIDVPGSADKAKKADSEVKSSDQAKQEAEAGKQQKADADLLASLGSKSLKNGMHDESVRSLQAALNKKLGKELATDGKFGGNTKDAVKEFQRQNGLKADGVVGPQTRAALTGGAKPEAKGAKTDGVTLPDNLPTPTARPAQEGDVKGEKAAEDATGKDGTAKQAGDGKLSFGSKLSGGQKTAINGMVADLKAKGFDVKANDIINFMAAETRGTFSTSIRAGGKKNGAVGLAQFTGIAVKDMNRFRSKNNQLTKAKIGNMSFDDQSKVVTEYLSTALGRKKMQGKDISASDLYMAVFSPANIGKPMNASIYSKSGSRRSYMANRSLDANKDGRITKSELSSRLRDWTARGAQLQG